MKKIVSQALTDLEISQEEFKTIINEEENYRKLKEDIRKMKSDDELSESNKNIYIYKKMKIHRIKNILFF